MQSYFPYISVTSACQWRSCTDQCACTRTITIYLEC